MAADHSRSNGPNDNYDFSNRLLAHALVEGPLTPRRCEAIITEALQLPDQEPWIRRLSQAMSPPERDHVRRVWNALKAATWYDAFELLSDYHPHDQE